MLSLIINNATVNFIGDPHLGKKFNKVQMHRRGEREEKQMKQFMDELMKKADVTVMVGDLFDTFLVSNELLVETYNIIKYAATHNPDRFFILMSGNHDISRDAEVTSSFHLLRLLLKDEKNITVAMETMELEHVRVGKFLVCPYSEFNSAAQEVEPYSGNNYSYVVGHWDTMPIAGPHNLVPLDALFQMTDIVVTGHIHTPSTTIIDNKTLHQTGSMQPYSHGEDATGEVYVTETIEQVEARLAIDPKHYHDKCLRLVVGKLETIPEIDCLQLTVKTVDGAAPTAQVVMEKFSFKELFFESLKETEVPEDIIKKYWEEYQQKGNDDTQS